MAINWRYVHVLVGVLLVMAGAFSLARMARGWNSSWRQAQLAAAQPAATQPTEAEPGDPATDAAKVKVYGVLAGASASNAAEEPTHSPAPAVHPVLDHVAAAPSAGPGHFLHKRFSVATYHGFEFMVPVHSLHPRLHGTFKSHVPGSNHGADVDVLLLNDQEFSDFVRGEEGTTTFSADASNGGEVDWALNSPMFQAQRYYLIFRSASAGLRSKVVDADFTLSSE
jgi:hypothetical protein